MSLPVRMREVSEVVVNLRTDRFLSGFFCCSFCSCKTKEADISQDNRQRNYLAQMHLLDPGNTGLVSGNLFITQRDYRTSKASGSKERPWSFQFQKHQNIYGLLMIQFKYQWFHCTELFEFHFENSHKIYSILLLLWRHDGNVGSLTTVVHKKISQQSNEDESFRILYVCCSC